MLLAFGADAYYYSPVGEAEVYQEDVHPDTMLVKVAAPLWEGFSGYCNHPANCQALVFLVARKKQRHHLFWKPVVSLVTEVDRANAGRLQHLDEVSWEAE